jgi:hypothetical protein
MAEGKAARCTRLVLMSYPQKRRCRQKEKKKQKKKNVWKYGKLFRVSHIPARQTNNKLFNLTFKKEPV